MSVDAWNVQETGLERRAYQSRSGLSSGAAQKRAVILDDVEGTVIAIAALMESIGFEVTGFDLKRPYLNSLKEGRTPYPDVIITDIRSPDMDGLEFLRELKADANLQQIPVVVSSSVLSSCRDDVRQLGAHGCLEKPWRAQDLLRMVTEIFENEPEGQNARDVQARWLAAKATDIEQTKARLAEAEAKQASQMMEVERLIHSRRPDSANVPFVPPFGVWCLQAEQQALDLNLEEALDPYIVKFNLVSHAAPDEPAKIATARAKSAALAQSDVSFEGDDAGMLESYKMSLTHTIAMHKRRSLRPATVTGSHSTPSASIAERPLRAELLRIVPRIAAAGMLFGALGDQEDYYYTLLRWAVCAVAGFTASYAFSGGKQRWGWTLAIIALFFNPLLPVHLDWEMWAPIDIVAAVLLLASCWPAIDRALSLRKGNQRQREWFQFGLFLGFAALAVGVAAVIIAQGLTR